MAFAEESVTITTYYPSPYGSYGELQLYPSAAPTCDSTKRGVMYYDDTANSIRVCNGSSWQQLSNFWTQSGNNLYPNDTAWNVGIGNTNPGANKLSVSGTVSATDFTCVDCLVAAEIGDGLGVAEINEEVIQQRVTGNCNGAVMVSINQNGTVNCETDDTGAGGPAGVSSLNGYTGAVTIGAGSNVSIDYPGGNTIRINSSAPAGTLTGSGSTNYIPIWNNSSTLGDSPFFIDSSTRMQLSRSLDISAGGGTAGNLVVKNGNLEVAGTSTLTGEVRVKSSLDLYNGGSGVTVSLPALATGTVNVRRATDNKLYQITSSKKYKDNIALLKDVFLKILSAEPKSFVDKRTREPGIGYIAEEFDALGLKNLVEYRDGKPEAISYDRIPLYILEVVKGQQVSLNEMNSALSLLKKENEKLKARLIRIEKRSE